jgi:hypothetical protein
MTKKIHAGVLVVPFFLSLAIVARAQQPQQSVSATQAQSVTVVGQRDASSWFRAESQHFIVFSDTTNEDVTALLNNLERLDYLLRIYTKAFRKIDNEEQKLTFYYHSRASGLNEIDADRPADAVGLYSSCGSGVQGFGVHLKRIDSLSNEQLEKSPLNESLSYLFEAYARHFLYRYTDIRTPTSFIDGFAQYFSSVRFTDTQMALGRTPTSIGDYLNFLDAGHRRSLDYDDVLEQNDTKGSNYAGEAGVRLEFEARSWLLTHYMLSSDEHRAQLYRYLNLVNRDVPATKAFESALGIKVSDIGNTMWRYRLGGIKVLRVELPELPSARVDFRSLPHAAGEFILANAALRSCPSGQAGESLLRKIGNATAKFPNNDFARLTLSRAQIDWGNAQDALPYLTAATQNDSANFDAFYLLGLANLRLSGQHKDAAKQTYLDAARRNLLRAVSLNPKSPEAAFAFFAADVNANEKPSETALQGVISARKGGHEINVLAKSAALAYLYLGDISKAKNALHVMAHDARDPQLAEWAKNWQSRLVSGVSQAETLAEMRDVPASVASFQEWTIDSASVMQAVRYNASLENAQHIIDGQAQGNPMTPENMLRNTPARK